MQKTSGMQIILISLLGFLGLGALVGGGCLMLSPSGSILHMPLWLLRFSPFKSFLLPGMLLFILLGIFPLWLIGGLLNTPENKVARYLNIFKDMHWSWSFTIYVVFTLIIWIQAEMIFLHAVSYLHTFYMFLALAILFVALLPAIRLKYKIYN